MGMRVAVMFAVLWVVGPILTWLAYYVTPTFLIYAEIIASMQLGVSSVLLSSRSVSRGAAHLLSIQADIKNPPARGYLLIMASTALSFGVALNGGFLYIAVAAAMSALFHIVWRSRVKASLSYGK